MAKVESFAAAVRQFGTVSYSAAYTRVKRGWSIHEAISIPPHQSRESVFAPGRKFGKLILIKKVSSSKSRDSRWECECECGARVTVLKKNLINGRTKSCGCLRKAIISLRGKK